MSADRSDAVSTPAPPSSDTALQPGTTIREFRIERLIGEGGFGIVYLAHDDSLDRTVALKEYMPSQLAERTAGTLSVQVRSQRYAETFEAGMRSFINEAKLLARFDHPSLLKVYRFFQDNGTAYMAMPFYEGQTLKAALRAMSGPPEEAWLRRMLYQVLDGLEVIHRHEVYHRDIAPDNILLQNDTPILLDFGAARRVIGDITRTLTVILKPGYAPIEQYGEDPNLKQGAWTDLYALAGVVHFALTREAPPASIARAMSDQLVPLARRLQGVYSDGLLTTIDKALSVRPQDRPQSVAELRSMLLASDEGRFAAREPAAAMLSIEPVTPPPRETAREVGPAVRDTEVAAAMPQRATDTGESGSRATTIGLALAIPAALAGLWWWITSRIDEPAAPPPRASAQQEYPASQPAPELAPVVPPPGEKGAPAPVPPTVAAAPKAEAAPPAKALKAAEAAKAKAQEPVKGAESAKAKAAEPSKATVVAEARPAPTPSQRVDAKAAPQPAPESVEAPKPPPQQVARVEPKPEAPPAPKAEAPKPVEVARVEPKAAAPAAQPSALVGRYSGRLVSDGSPVAITLQILSVDNGTVSATANYGTGRCEGDYRMTGTVLNDSLRMRSTHGGGRYGDCSFGFRVAIQGTKLTGQTTSGSPLELAR